MRIAVSNIAWDVAEDEAIAAMLGREGVDAVDAAPGKYFPDPERATAEEMARVRRWWEARGIQITGMQALLFGTEGLNLFGAEPSRRAMLERLAHVCRIGEGLGARRLVFGSPRNRDRGELPDQRVLEVAVGFFGELGARAAAHGVTICLEANPPAYGCNFMTTTGEAATVVAAVDHPAVRLHLDTGTMAMNGEPAADTVRRFASLVGYVHASEPDLAVVGEGGAPHDEVAGALRQALPQAIVSIEMRATEKEPHLASVQRAVRFVKDCYGAAHGAEA